MRVIFMGTPEFAVPCLDHLLLERYQVVSVYTKPDRPAGRQRNPQPSPVKRVAQRWQLPVLQPLSLKEADALEQLAALKPDVIVVAAYGQILPQAVLDLPKYGCLNVHPSLLPRFRGASPVAAAILAGDELTGVSIMLLDSGMDTGPVLRKTQALISPQDTAGSLTDKLSLVGAQLLLEVLPLWFRGEITPQAQNNAEATYCSPLSREDGEIDWHLPALDIWRRVRAFQPWPWCYTTWRGRQLRILEAVPLPEEAGLKVGQVVALNPPREGVAFGICSGSGVLGVLKIQLAGKQAMSAADFLRGQRQFLGAVLPSL